MTINQIIMYIMAFGVLLGGGDRILGNRFGLGVKFENAFRLMGNIGLSMAGIICLAPLLSAAMGGIVTPLCRGLHIDPGIFGSILSIDMGGYQLALDLAEDPQIGRFSGIIVSSIFGCTVVFTIPVGIGVIGTDDRLFFTRGILLGFIAMPFAAITGGLMLGLTLLEMLWNSLPVFLISGLLFIGILKQPNAMMKGFQLFARLIQIAATAGLTLAAIRHICGIELVKGMPPLQEAMQTVCSISIIMLGSMPIAELLQRVLRGPFEFIRKKTGLNPASTTGLLLSTVSITPALAMIPDMDKRGKIVFSAYSVCGCSFLAAHLAFTMSTQPDMVPALLCTKILGGLLGASIALFATCNQKNMA